MSDASYPLIAFALLLILLIGSAWFYGDEGRIARSVVLRFFLTIALPVAVLLGAPLVLIALAFDVEVRLLQAVIAGLVIATGWLTTAIFTEQSKVRIKAERLRDYHKAIYAEIGNTLESLWESGESDRYVAALTARMEEDETYVPFIPKELHDHVYNAVITEIDVLPRQTIDAIVAYYSLIKSLAALAEDMRGDTYKTLSAHRRIAIYTDYVGMRKQGFLFGQYALRLIGAYSKGGATAAQQIINTQGGGRSAKSQGSV